ncbi:MAG TPA: RcnB family protein [Sphingomicrobium sp.]|nr:RcnB family protein [Sphingomicrobium sp.]
MKKIVLGLAGASIALTGFTATPAAAADFRGHDRGQFEQVQNRSFLQNRSFVQNRFVNNDRAFAQNRFTNSRFEGRQWHRGDRFDSRYAMNYRRIDNPGYYNLQPAPYGYRWVQSGNDAVLVAVASGLIGALVGNAF